MVTLALESAARVGGAHADMIVTGVFDTDRVAAALGVSRIAVALTAESAISVSIDDTNVIVTRDVDACVGATLKEITCIVRPLAGEPAVRIWVANAFVPGTRKVDAGRVAAGLEVGVVVVDTLAAETAVRVSIADTFVIGAQGCHAVSVANILVPVAVAPIAFAHDSVCSVTHADGVSAADSVAESIPIRGGLVGVACRVASSVGSGIDHAHVAVGTPGGVAPRREVTDVGGEFAVDASASAEDRGEAEDCEGVEVDVHLLLLPGVRRISQ